MKPSKVIPSPSVAEMPYKYSRAAQMGLSVAPRPNPAISGVSLPNNIIYTPGKSIDLAMQRYYSAKARAMREMEFLRTLAERARATTEVANKVIAQQELFQSAMQLRNDIKGLLPNQSLALARDQRQLRAVQAGTTAAFARNDINALLRRELPAGGDVNQDNPLMPQGGLEGQVEEAAMSGAGVPELGGMGKGQAQQALEDRLEHLEGLSTDAELGALAGATRQAISTMPLFGDQAEAAMGRTEEAIDGRDGLVDASEGAGGVGGAIGKREQAELAFEAAKELQAQYAKATEGMTGAATMRADPILRQEIQRLRNRFNAERRKYEMAANIPLGFTLTDRPTPRGKGSGRGGAAASTGATTQSLLSQYES